MKKVIYLFRNDLRLHDQPVLKQIEGQDLVLIPVFCFDSRMFVTHELGFKKTGDIRALFLMDAVNNLRANLRRIGSDLLILHGKTEKLISDLIKNFGADEMYAEKEDTHEETTIEQELSSKINIPLLFHEGKTLLATCELPFRLDDLPDVFTSFRKKVEPLLQKVRSLTPPKKLPPFPDEFASGRNYTPTDFGLVEPNFDSRGVLKFNGGEDEGLKRLNKFIWEDRSVLHYKETRNGMVGEKYSSKFSPWLANGSLSTKKVFTEVKNFEREVSSNDSTYWLVFELLWRDYFRFVAKKYGKKIFFKGGIKNQPQYFVNDHSLFEKWRTGKTGNDFVDANMTELSKTGFMSNRGRQNVASYLCKDLKIDWRWGAAWFESQLIDYDVTSNWGNWMYIAGVGNDPRPNRYFNVNKQAEKYDPDGKYRNLWLSN